MKKGLFYTLSTLSFMLSAELHAQESKDHWLLTFRNAYIDRNYEALPDAGSWSQAASLFYTSDLYDTPLQLADQPIQIGVDASVQYAVRLSGDKHVDDVSLPFKNGSQASDQLKYGGTLKVAYDKTMLRVGELWLDTPITAVDKSRQLWTSYWGANLSSHVTDKLKVELGRVTKVSARNGEDFEKFSMNRGANQSSGLNYLDLRYQLTPSIKGEYYFGQMEDLYQTHYVGLEHLWKPENFTLQSKLKYFTSKEDGSQIKVDSQNFGIIETLSVQKHRFSLGYQQFFGDTAYPLMDGFLPETYMVNWNVTPFVKKDEKSYHAIYQYDFNDYVAGLSTILKYSYGHGFKDTKGRNNKETEAIVILNYAFQQPYLKGVSVQAVNINYDNKHGNNDFTENRIFVNYQKAF